MKFIHMFILAIFTIVELVLGIIQADVMIIFIISMLNILFIGGIYYITMSDDDKEYWDNEE